MLHRLRALPTRVSSTFNLSRRTLTSTMDAATKRQYLADDAPVFVPLAIKPHFDKLQVKEQKYAHYLSLASWTGTRITCRQISPESEGIYDMIIALHKSCNGDYKSLANDSNVSDQELNHYLNYAGQFLGNNGNYKCFGDSKFIPRIAPDSFLALVSTDESAKKHLDSVGGIKAVYETDTIASMHLGYTSQGHMTTYYPQSPNITEDEIEAISKWCSEHSLLAENTRLEKKNDGNFVLHVASSETAPAKYHRDLTESHIQLDGSLTGKKLSIVYGDYHHEMSKIVKYLENARKYSANDTQLKLHEEYIKSFRTGSMQAFKDSQRQWIKDKGPEVESMIGFVETYRDPHGIRGEFEGFVAMVNKDRTKAFSTLVDASATFISRLPWPAAFEKDKFLAPDFTSLEVMTFAGSGPPAGINIPNFDDIRQDEGFKNVSLGNVLNAKPPKQKIPFLRDEVQELYAEASNDAFEVQVALHELLGHGCGKLLAETEPGKYNFDINNPPTNPLTGKAVTSWYKHGQTYNGILGQLSSAIEECRAESVAMSLSCDFEALKIFGFGDGKENIDGKAGDILYCSYLSMARAGLAGLQSWEPTTRKWGQAHSQARNAILNVFLSAGPEFCRLEHNSVKPYITDDGEKIETELELIIDRTKILSHGRPVIDEFLQKLNVMKATADAEGIKTLFHKYTDVSEYFEKKVRPEVLRRAMPRRQFVQVNTVIHDEGVEGKEKIELREYPATAEGMIQSFVDRDYC